MHRFTKATSLAGVVGLVALAMGATWQASGAATVVGIEGEAMSSMQGYGTSVRADATASGGKVLRMDSAVTARGLVTLSAAATGLTVTMRTDNAAGSGASARVRVDGVLVASQDVTSTKWTTFTYTRPTSAGSRDVRIEFLNPQKRNLFVDVTRFTTDGPSPSPSQTSPAPSPSASQTTTPPVPTPSATTSTGEVRAQAYVTGYSYWDNTPPGSAAISDPVLHQTAGGTGTYADPITVAVGHSIIGGTDILDFPAGTRFYVPNLRRYFLVEDTCGDGNTPQNGPCHTGYPAGASFWIDVWVGGGGVSSAQADACMNAITDVHMVIRNPAANYVVTPGEITANCTQYGETPVVA